MRCTPEFFGTTEIPVIEINREILETLATESTGQGFTVPGVQKKLSLHLSDDNSARLTLIGYPGGYILKPQTENFANLPEAEDLVMDIAEYLGVRTVPHGLIHTSGGWAYITKRVDRRNGESFAMEDFCQLSERLTQDKYRGSYERCAKIIDMHSVRKGFDMSEFFFRLVICFVTGNSDMHLKNFSLIETEPGNRKFALSPAYDLLPVNLVMPEDTEETALTLNGKKSNLKRKDFLALADTIKLNPAAADKMISNVLRKSDGIFKICRGSELPEDMKMQMEQLIEHRLERLKN